MREVSPQICLCVPKEYPVLGIPSVIASGRISLDLEQSDAANTKQSQWMTVKQSPGTTESVDGSFGKVITKLFYLHNIHLLDNHKGKDFRFKASWCEPMDSEGLSVFPAGE